MKKFLVAFLTVIMVVSTAFLVACGEQKTINITFDGNGGFTAGGKSSVTISVKMKNGVLDVFSYPIFEKDNCHFIGWSVDPATVKEDTVITAIWSGLTEVKIHFDSKGGTACGDYTLTRDDSSYNLPRPTKGTLQASNDYSFTGWWYKASASATAVQITSIAQIWALNEAEITLYATWESNWIGPH